MASCSSSARPSAIGRIEAGELSRRRVLRRLRRGGRGRRAQRLPVDGRAPAPRGAGGEPLRGAPVAVKDLFCTEGSPTTAGSRILEGYVPPYTATAVARLGEAGARLLGKTNMDEFAMGSSNENSGYGPVRNPWDRDRVPGRLLGRFGGRGRRTAWRRGRSAPTPAARSASRPRCAGSSASSPPTARSRATGWSPSPPRSTSAGR